MISYESLQFRPNLEKIARNNQKSFLSTKNKYKDKGKLLSISSAAKKNKLNYEYKHVKCLKVKLSTILNV